MIYDYGLNIITSPVVEPITIDEAKKQLRIDNTFTEEDELIHSYIKAARKVCEEYQGRTYIETEYLLTLDNVYKSFDFPVPPLTSVSEVKILYDDETEVIVNSEDYIIDTKSHKGRFYFRNVDDYNLMDLREYSCFQITFKAGYGQNSDDVPEVVKLAIKLLIGHYYENREATIMNITPAELPLGVKSLLSLDTANYSG